MRETPLSPLSMKIGACIALACAILLPRLTQLGSIYTIDERLWRARGSEFIQAIASGNLQGTTVAYQPGIPTAWLAALVERFDSLAVSQASIAITVSILLGLAAYGLVKILGWKWGMTSAFVVALNPELIAHSRVVHTDALLALFILNGTIFAVLAFMRPAYSRGHMRYIIGSGALFGLAILTKLFALFAVIPVLVYVLIRSHKIAGLRSTIVGGGIWLLSASLVIIACWPALWVAPLRTIRYLIDNLLQFSSGRRVGEASALWWYYSRELFARATLIGTLIFPIGLAALLTKRFSRHRELVWILLITSLSYVLLLHIGKDRDARYLLVAYITADMLAVLGIRYIAVTLFTTWRTIAEKTLILCIATISLYTAVSIHPYYLAFHNPLFSVPDTFKIGWGEGLDLAASYIASQNKDANILAFYSSVFEYNWEQAGGTGAVNSIDFPAPDTDYLVIYRGMFERASDSIETQLVDTYIRTGNYAPEKVISLAGIPYVWIFNVSNGNTNAE